MKSVRSAAVALSALIFVAAGAAGAPARAADAPKALSPWDAQLYAAAFEAVKKGDFAAAEQNTAKVSDKSLLGFVEFQKLFHPTAYTATYAELMAWLDKYSDLPGAQRVRALAAKRKPAETGIDPNAAAPMAAPAAGPRTWESIDAVLSALQSGERIDALTPKAAREALNAGDLGNARRLAVEIGDWWVAGLAAWRQRDYEEAFRRFEMIALDVTEDPWVRSGGAYWAARAAVAKGEPQRAPELLRVAAQFPHTFYGMIAERQLGLEPALRTGPQPYAPQVQPAVVRTAAGPDIASPALQELIKSNPRAKRAVALAQLGQNVDAGLELRAGMQAARGDQERADWTALALALNGQLSAGRAREIVDPRDYPTPDLAANAPLTIDKALLYALMRRESRFDPSAKSSAGAYGLMQVMPSTAAWLVGDDKLAKKPDLLLDPDTNLRVGQAYIAYLAGQGPVANDIFRVVAAYNGGPARVLETAKQLGPDADVLTFIESIQVPQTRVYVEEVMAAYWTYRRIFGQDTKSLDAVAAGAKLVDLRLDTQGPPVTQVVAPASLAAGQK